MHRASVQDRRPHFPRQPSAARFAGLCASLLLALASVLAAGEGLPPGREEMASSVAKEGDSQAAQPMPITPVAAWEKDFHQALQRPVRMEFVDLPVGEAVAFLSSMCRANLVVDSRLAGAAGARIALQVRELTGEAALMEVLRLAGLDYKLRDEALFIHAAGLYADGPPPPLREVRAAALEKAVADLGAEDFDARQRASTAISALGPAAAPALHAALSKSSDPEVRMRLKELLGRFPTADFFAEPSDVTAVLERLERRVSFELAETPLQRVVPFLAEQAHLQANVALKLTAAAEARDLPVTLRSQSMRLGNALRWIARLSGARLSLRDGALVFEKRP